MAVSTLTAADVRAALRQRYGPPEHAIFFEVANSTGFEANRWADAVSIGCWPSRGMYIQGFEIKVSKYDWRREKDNPRKAEAVARYCDFWWLVTTDGVVGDVSEIPAGWGWLLLLPDGHLTTKKAAHKLEAQQLDRKFVASLLRNAGKVDQAEIDAAVEKAVEERTRRLREEQERKILAATTEVAAKADRRMRKYAKAEEILGETVAEYFNDAEFVSAVKLVIELGVARSYNGVLQLRDQMASLVERFDKAVADGHLPSQQALFEVRKFVNPRHQARRAPTHRGQGNAGGGA